MREDIKILIKNAEKSYYHLNFNNFDKENIDEVIIEIKHIVEDLRSVLDYIANDIYYMYNTEEKSKIYFPYTKLDKDETYFNEMFTRNFGTAKEQNIKIYEIIKNIQHFNNVFWLNNLMHLCNNVKHIKLEITKIKVEKHTIITDKKTTVETIDNMQINKIGENIYGVFGEGEVYLSGGGVVEVYPEGIAKIGEGIYNINDESKHNLETNKYEIDKLFFEGIEEKEAQLVLKDIFDGVKKLVNNIEKSIGI